MGRRMVRYMVVNARDGYVGPGAPGFRATWRAKRDLKQQVLDRSEAPNNWTLEFWDGELWLKWDEPDDLPGPEKDPLRIRISCPQAASQQAGTQQKFTADLVVWSGKEKTHSKEDCKIRFDKHPSFTELLDAIEQYSLSLDTKLDNVNYIIWADQEIVLESTWGQLSKPRQFIQLEVIPQKPKPLSSFTNEEGMKLLLGPNHATAMATTTVSFPMAELNMAESLEDAVTQLTNMQSVDDLLKHLGVDLALRCLRSDPHLHSKGYAKRELISPVLYTASILAGELEVAAEYNARDSDAVGSVDFVILRNQFVISVLEGKLHESMTEHEGQLFASMHACREQYLKKQNLKKRKRDDDPMTQVPTVGILSNGTGYMFYKCHCNGQHNGGQVLECSRFYLVALDHGMSAAKASEEVGTVLRTVVQLFVDQKDALDLFWLHKA